MTSQIYFPANYSKSIIDNSITSNSDASTGLNEEFKDLLSSMLSATSLFSDQESSGTTDLTPVLMMLITQLFGLNFSTEDITYTTDSPQGTPLKGQLTQGSHDGHVAVDFGVPVGTRVQSTMSGKVVYAGWNNEGYGNLVIVENGAYRTYYAHLSSIPVKVGQSIDEGEIIGLSGNTGNSTGPHLHYEIRKNGVAIDPTATMNGFS